MDGREQLNKPKILVLLAFMVVAGVLRALPFPPNFAPIGAMALFGGAYFADRRMAFLLPLVVMLFSDFILELLYLTGMRQYGGFHEQMICVYLAFVGMVFIGRLLKNRVNVFSVTAASFSASVLFFVVSNFGVWAMSSVDYTHDFSGLVNCYAMAIPFFRNTVLGDLFFCALMFGTFEAIKYRFPKLAYIHKQ